MNPSPLHKLGPQDRHLRMRELTNGWALAIEPELDFLIGALTGVHYGPAFAEQLGHTQRALNDATPLTVDALTTVVRGLAAPSVGVLARKIQTHGNPNATWTVSPELGASIGAMAALILHIGGRTAWRSHTMTTSSRDDG